MVLALSVAARQNPGTCPGTGGRRDDLAADAECITDAGVDWQVKAMKLDGSGTFAKMVW